VAIACCMIIYFYVVQEFNYDNFHKNADKIYRVNYKGRFVFGDFKDVRVEPEIADLLKRDVPQIEKSAEYRFAFEKMASFDYNYFDVQTALASEDFFDMFSFTFLAGKSSKCLANPYEAVITRKLADKLIAKKGNYNTLIGKSLEFPLNYEKESFRIIGVVENIPHNSSINFDVVVSGKSGRNFGGCDNSFGYTSVFYQVKADANPRDAEKNVNQYIAKFYKSRIEQMQSENQMLKTADAFVPFVLPLKDIYLAGDIDNCFEKSTNKKSFIILMTIGGLIMLIACSNYILLSLGQYLKKIGEVGIRKAMGATSIDIFSLFMSESFILTFVALVAGGLMCYSFIPIFENLAETHIYIPLIDIRKALIFCMALIAGIVVFTSIVPVLIFSKISPNQMAGKKIRVGNKNRTSQVFVSFQYSLSIILIIVTLFIIRQSNFLKTQSLGLSSNNIIDASISKLDDQQKETFKTLVGEHPGVTNLTLADRNFMNGSSDSFVDKGNGEQIIVFRFVVDHDYISTLKLKLIHGTDFTVANETKSDRTIIVNKKFTELFEIEDDPIGKTYDINGVNFTIIGVVDDYHFFDMKSKINPAMLACRKNFGNDYNSLLVRFNPQNVKEVVNHLKKSYEQIAPGKTFNYSFWDERLNQRYDEEERWSRIVAYASIIAIIISSLGLFGLTVLLINQRVKEIGIRKVNGAGSIEILFTIYKTFIVWLLGALIIAMPVGYYIVDKWLSNFPYKVALSWWVFVMAATLALVIAIVTLSWQSWKAATRNPVESLRYE
jgi:putative ABC transport system permease protein